jgi:diguanylate cyclase (GGDEF)-like protein/PAS domain S-box-containing protein
VEGTTILRSGAALKLPPEFDLGTLGGGVLRLFAHSTRTSLALLDRQARVVWANPAFDMLGLAAGSQWLGRELLELLDPPGALPQDQDSLALLRQALRHGAATHATLAVRSAGGRRLWLEADLQPLRSSADSLSGFALVLSDVSARVRERQRLRNLIDAAIAGILVQDEDGRIIDCNLEAERLLGRSRAQLLGLNAYASSWEAVHEDGRACSADEFPATRVLASGEPVRGCVIGLRLPDGERRWLEVNSQLMGAEDGGERLVVSSFINLSAQKAAQARLVAEREVLLASLDRARAGVWEWEPESGQARVDARWAEMLGRDPARLEGESLSALVSLIHPDDLGRAKQLIYAHLRGESEHFECELRVRHASGQWLWVLSRARVALRDEHGRALRVFGTHTELVQRAREEGLAQAAHGLLKGLFERASLGIALNDLVDGRFCDANPALLQMLGRSREALLESSYWDITPPEYAQAEAEQLRSLMDTGAYGPYEKEFVRDDGVRVPVLLSGVRITQPDGAEQIWSVIQDLSERRQFELQLRRAALTDELTGLPNRSMLMQRLQQSLLEVRAGLQPAAALLFIDLDRFKAINDRLGHDAGDRLLCGVAARMRACLRAVDVGLAVENGNVVARLGGDEFVVLLADVSSEALAMQVGQRLLQALALPYAIDNAPCSVAASVGLVLLDGSVDSADEVLRRADRAMYRAKSGGGGRVVRFTV